MKYRYLLLVSIVALFVSFAALTTFTLQAGTMSSGAMTADNTVEIQEQGFVPATITVTVGMTVTWHNSTAVPHTVQSGLPYSAYLPAILSGGATSPADSTELSSIWQVNESFGSLDLPAGGDASYLFTTAGEYPYFLVANRDLSGTVIVEGDMDGDGLADRVETNTGIYISPDDTGTDPNDPDTDNDNLNDGAETNTGVFVDANNAGTDPHNPDTDADSINDGDEVLGTAGGLDLPGMGANPLKKNILLEYDWFDDNLDPGICAAHTHRPTQAMVDRVSLAFANSPVSNPDGSTGIVLIHDFGQGGLFTGGNFINDANGVISGGVNGTEFQAYKSANFAANRHGYFHYVLLPHRYNTNSGSSGQAELPGDDLVVSLYCYGSEVNVANTIMHELGHNLLLRHGGNENCNYKPNYNSVMNYRYQFPGVDSNCTPPGDGVLNYSVGDRISLNELDLNENLGTCGTVAWDWDNDTVIEASIAFDINPEDTSSCGGTLTQLNDYNDWANLYFAGLSDGDGALPIPQEIITDEEPPLGLLEANK